MIKSLLGNLACTVSYTYLLFTFSASDVTTANNLTHSLLQIPGYANVSTADLKQAKWSRQLFCEPRKSLRFLLKSKAAHQSAALLRRQVVENAIEQQLSDHQLVGTARSTHIRSGFSSVLTCRYIHRTAPTYLADELLQPADLGIRTRLWSVLTTSLPVRHTRLSTVGDQAFPVAAARTWNTVKTATRKIGPPDFSWCGKNVHLISDSLHKTYVGQRTPYVLVWPLSGSDWRVVNWDGLFCRLLQLSRVKRLWLSP